MFWERKEHPAFSSICWLHPAPLWQDVYRNDLLQNHPEESSRADCLDVISIPAASVAWNRVPLQVAPTCSGAQQVTHREARDLHTVEELITLGRLREGSVNNTNNTRSVCQHICLALRSIFRVDPDAQGNSRLR